ncbi:MAG: CapA family protein, partial [Acidimicrobiales bacterium]|nr:CapA family protein [Acidimicrobiales bacterium]
RSLLLLGAAAVLAACTSSVDDGTTASTEPPATTTTTVPAATRLVVNATGELTFDPAVVPAAAADPTAALAAVAPTFTADDLTVATLACAVTDPAAPCAPAALDALAAAGVDVVALATDGMDPAGATATVDAVAAAGMTPVGAGPDAAAALAPAFVEVSGRTVAVVSVSMVGPEEAFATATTAGIADGRDVFALGTLVADAADRADLVIVSVHWGEEQSQGPRPEDALLARALADAGADLVVGHGPHRLHRLEAYGPSLLALSLGDLVGPGDPPPTTDTALLRAVWAPDGPVVGCLLHATIASPGLPTLDEPSGTTCPGEV